ncbi:hypothetical protein [Adhaeribacter aquaticus]|uniref:hypothetical protein n=1 Tax=Adhaeribacter aquaticus TaxID=299567 RepID=UPI00047BE600|nr:hypothetical protein [Adhaeribacter aquaticus]
MKYINLPLILFSLIFVSFGCQKEYIEPKSLTEQTVIDLPSRAENTPCKSYFYYYNQDKVQLGNVSTKRVIIGFQDGFTTEQKNQFISNHSFLQNIESENHTGSADATVILLKEGITCSQVQAGLDLLKQSKAVRYATPFFSNDGSDRGITNQFIVNLKSTSTLADLENMAKRTNTKIVDQLSNLTYILSADKTSQGNALEMANFFHENNKIDSSEPDFFFIFSGSYVSKD